MDLIEAFRMGLESIKQRKLRSFLTTLGIVIGIIAIVALLSIGEGFKVTVNNAFQSVGVNVLTVIPFSSEKEGGMFPTRFKATNIKFTLDDVNKVKKVKDVSLAVPVIMNAVTLEKSGEEVSATAVGVDIPELFKMYPGLKLEKGSIQASKSGMALTLGHYIAYSGEEEFVRVGEKIKLRFVALDRNMYDYSFRVTSVLNKSGFSSLIGSFDENIFLPFTTAQKIFRSHRNISAILVYVEDTNKVDSVASQIEEMYNHDVTAFSFKTILDVVSTMLNTLELVLGSIAAISLFVAGIGIMNTMLIAVMERTREIGVMKAIGAKDRDILVIFLSEALLIGLIGGITGSVLGVFAAEVLGKLGFGGLVRSMRGGAPAAIEPVFSPILLSFGVFFAAVVSVIFALYPAYKASRLQPVEALRYE